MDFILTCIEHPAAANETFLLSDGEGLPNADLFRRAAAAVGVPARLVPVPTVVLEACAAVLGTRALVQRLCGSLQVDIGKARRTLGWRPPVSVDDGLRRAVQSLGARAT